MKYKQFSELPIGILFLAIALLIERFLPENNAFDFTVGLLIGLTIVLNLKYAYKRSKKTLSV